MSIQATLIPPALAALHNFIRQYDPDEIQMYVMMVTTGDDNREPIQSSISNGSSSRVAG